MEEPPLDLGEEGRASLQLRRGLAAGRVPLGLRGWGTAWPLGAFHVRVEGSMGVRKLEGCSLRIRQKPNYMVRKPVLFLILSQWRV